jgi:hypothetical protein
MCWQLGGSTACSILTLDDMYTHDKVRMIDMNIIIRFWLRTRYRYGKQNWQLAMMLDEVFLKPRQFNEPPKIHNSRFSIQLLTDVC